MCKLYNNLDSNLISHLGNLVWFIFSAPYHICITIIHTIVSRDKLVTQKVCVFSFDYTYDSDDAHVNGWWKRCENWNMIWYCLDATFDFIWCLSQQTIDSILIFICIFIRLCLFVGGLCVRVCVLCCANTHFLACFLAVIWGACISIVHIFLIIWMAFIECAPLCTLTVHT